MANVFQNTSLVARDAAIELHGAITTAGLVSGKHEAKFAQKVGNYVDVKVRPIMTASRHTGSGAFGASYVSEGKVRLQIKHRAYVKVPLTGEELTFSVDDFALQVTRPAMLALAKDVDAFLIDQLVAGFARNTVGTDGTNPSTIAHLVAGYQKLFDQEAPTDNLGGIITSTAMASFLQLPQFTSRDYGDGQTAGLRNALLSQLYGINFYPNQRAGSHDRGDIAGTVLVKGAAQTGTSIIVDGFTAATGTVTKGTRLTFAADSTIYTVAQDCTIAANTATLVLTSAKAVAAADDAAVTFKDALKQNVIFSPDAAAKALIAPAPQRGNPSAVGVFEGISVRTTFESSISDSSTGDSEAVLFDVFVAGEVIVPDGGVVLQG